MCEEELSPLMLENLTDEIRVCLRLQRIVRVKPQRQAGQTHARTFWKCSVVGYGSPTAINLRNS